MVSVPEGTVNWALKNTPASAERGVPAANGVSGAAGRRKLELAFHTPETVSSWSARWSGGRTTHDPEEMFWRWSERFPVTGIDAERWMMANQLILECDGGV